MDSHTPATLTSQPQQAPNKRKRILNLDAILEVFNVEPQDYQVAWRNLEARIKVACSLGHPKTLAPTSLNTVWEALNLFNLHDEDYTNPFTDIQTLPVPKYLEESIARINAVTNKGNRFNETLSRTILDQILICSIYEEGNAPYQLHGQDKQSNNAAHAHPSTSDTCAEEDPAKLELLYEMPLSRLVTHEGETKLLSGFADYSIWYDSSKEKTLATNLLIVDAKRRYGTDAALPQLASYMGIIYTAHKEESKDNCVVYGASSDGVAFRFCKIGNDGVFVQSDLLEWPRHKDQIYAIMRSLIRAAALSSPSTTPIKDPMRRKLILESIRRPKCADKFDCGLGSLEVFYEDEEDWLFIKLRYPSNISHNAHLITNHPHSRCGSNVGQGVARAFASKGYKVALVARTLKEADNTTNKININADLSDPSSVAGIFTEVKRLLGIPSVVVYNAAAVTPNDPKHPLSLPLADFNRDFNLNTTSAFVAAQQAMSGFEQLPESDSRTFIYTGNITNTTTMGPLLDLGVGKSASAHIIESAAIAYKDRGYKFYYGDERKPDSAAAFKIDGEAHGKLYLELAEGETQGPWQQTFVKGVGYKSFPAA